MIPSLSEVSATARKASRGAGYSWGMADETGRATAWLWAQGIDSITALAEVLDRQNPVTCPIHIGTQLCDAPPQGPVTFDDVNGPILLLSFAAELSKITGKSYRLTIGKAIFCSSPDGLFSITSYISENDKVTLEAGATEGRLLQKSPRRAAPETAWARLCFWEHKTYAPATEASRLAGAGAGLSDND